MEQREILTIRSVVRRMIEPVGTPLKDAKVYAAASNLGIDLFNDSGTFLPLEWQVAARTNPLYR